jgi:uncharacterized protein YbdZ (MbtH family)
MGPIGCRETSVGNCHHLLRNSPEVRSSRRNMVSSWVLALDISSSVRPHNRLSHPPVPCVPHMTTLPADWDISHVDYLFAVSVITNLFHENYLVPLHFRNASNQHSMWPATDTHYSSIKQRHIKRTSPNQSPCAISKSCGWFCVFI